MSFDKVKILTKVFLKNSFRGLDKSGIGQEKRKKGMVALYFFIFIYLGAILGVMSYNIINALIPINQEEMFLGIFFLAIATMVIFQSIFSIANVFYFSKDIEYILPMPIKPWEILLAKFNVILITEYVMTFLLGIVPIIIYGILTSSSILFYIFSIIGMLVFPIFPLAIESIIIILIMSLGKFTKDKDKLQLISTIILIVVIVAVQFLLVGNQEQMTEEQIIQTIMKANGMVELIKDYIPTLNPTIQMVTNNNIVICILEFLKLLLITIASLIFFIILGNKLYLKGAVQNASSKVYKKQNINVEKIYKRKKIGISYVKKEFLILIRNPIYFMQCILPPVLMPILIGAISIGGMNPNTEDLGQMLSQINEVNLQGIIPMLIILGIMQFFSMMCFIAVTAISRDGKNAVFMKYIPVALEKQIVYKIIPNIIMNMIPAILTLAVVKFTFTNTNIIYLLYILIIHTLLIIAQSFFMIIVDLKRPKLEWDTEYAVVKQNMNMIFQFAFVFIIMLIFVLIGSILNFVPSIVGYIILLVLSLALVYLVEFYINKNIQKLFEKIY